MISYSRAPLGACTDATSPSDLPISARAIGELIEIEAVIDVGFVVADDLVLHRLARIQILQFDRRAEHDAAVRIERGRDR